MYDEALGVPFVTLQKEPKLNFVWTLNEISKGSGDFKLALKVDEAKAGGIDMSGWVLTGTFTKGPESDE